jgi:hypothetical protein
MSFIGDPERVAACASEGEGVSMLDWSQGQVEAAAIAGLISIIVALGTIAAGIWRSWAEQRQANKRPFLEKQLALCFEAVEATGRLASETDLAEWEKLDLHSGVCIGAH